MNGVKCVACAIGLGLSLVAGCNSVSVFDAFGFKSGTSGSELILLGSPDAVALAAQSTLSGMGLAASVSRNGESVLVTSKTKDGRDFSLEFLSEKTSAGERTRVRIDASVATDASVLQLMAQLQTGRRPPAAQ